MLKRSGQRVGDEATEGGGGGGGREEGSDTGGERYKAPSLAEMKGYFNWVSDACLILFSTLIPHNVHKQNKYTQRGVGGGAVNRTQ